MCDFLEHTARAERARLAEEKRQRDDRMLSRMATTYQLALAASHGLVRVRIHVGQTIWDWLRTQANRPTAAFGDTLWGFDILLEAGWEPERIVVRADQEVH